MNLTVTWIAVQVSSRWWQFLLNMYIYPANMKPKNLTYFANYFFFFKSGNAAQLCSLHCQIEKYPILLLTRQCNLPRSKFQINIFQLYSLIFPFVNLLQMGILYNCVSVSSHPKLNLHDSATCIGLEINFLLLSFSRMNQPLHMSFQLCQDNNFANSRVIS